jgi:hypothetical protein
LSPAGKASVEIIERLLEPHLGGVEFAHRLGEAVLGKVGRLHAAGLGDQLHRSLRRSIVTFGEHVDVGMGHPPTVKLARELGQASIAELLLLHQVA